MLEIWLATAISLQHRKIFIYFVILTFDCFRTERVTCNNPTSVWTCVSTTKYRIRENHPDATKKDHIKEIQQSSGFLAIKVNARQLKTIKKE